MKNILLIGVGGTGSNAVDILNAKINELGNQTKSNISAIVFDTDVGSVETIKSATPISMADPASVGTICDRVGLEYIREWFPCDDKAVRSQEMIRGASQWRKKSYLAFLNLMNKPQARSAFIGALEDMSKDPSATCEVYVIASIAGGTGSGSFIPIALYARRYLRKQLGKNPIVNAMVALPDIYAASQTEDNRIKIYANAYAILRELNAIYLVARNFNEGERTKMKKAPVKFKIGNANEPNVGVLFDADDPQFWTPEAAPFTQIFVLDRIPGLKSIAAHDIVLANSLYTLICTDIGVEFDSEASNHEILRSQNNGSNAIYASIATSQMTFPVETILDYLAHDKALKACDGEWLVLHREVEKKLREIEQESQDTGRKYIAKEGEYALMMLDALKNDEENNDGIVNDLVARGTAVYTEDGKVDPSKTTADDYFEKLDKTIEEKIQPFEAVSDGDLKISIDELNERQDLISASEEIKDNLLSYFKQCVSDIKRMRTSVSESIISFDKNKFDIDKVGSENNKLSLIDGLLKKDKKFVHPVTAMVQLCRFRKLLLEAQVANQEWSALKRRDVSEIEPGLLDIKVDKCDGDAAGYKITSSAYAKGGNARFSEMMNEGGGNYAASKKRTKLEVDRVLIEIDAKFVAKQIRSEATKQLKTVVYKRLAKEVDLLIEKYKNFFSRFEKEKEDLVEDTKTALRKDSGLVDSILNIYSTEADKNEIKDKVFRNVGPESVKSLEETDDLVGKGVFTSVYNSAYATYNEMEIDDRNVAAYRALFGKMVKAYKEFIKKSDSFKLIASYNIVEAMEASCASGKKSKESIFAEYFSKVQSLATPALKIDTRMDLGDLVEPSNIVVYMMSKETGNYIKKHADELKLQLPQGQTKEDAVIKSCAEAFIRKYSGNDSARVSIVKDMSSAVLYCTGEIMDITPLRIPKFNELSNENDNIYYINYCKAIRNFKYYATDMWNPHIGNNLFQRGYLPFMNEKKEDLEDVKMVKALLQALSTKQIVYTQGLSQSRDEYYFRYVRNGVKSVIKGNDGKVVNTTNIVQLINWLRNEDDLVEEWSDEFDREIDAQKRSLPSITTDSGSQVAILESALTKSPFMGFFHEKLFQAGKKNQPENITLLEFAYMIKTSEEASRDCDYAERIIKTSYEVFKDIVSYRANPSTTPELFLNIYKQQLGKVFESFAGSKTVKTLGEDCDKFVMQIIGWLESQNTFVVQPLDEEGGNSLKGKFSYEDFDKVEAKVNEIKAQAKKKEKKEDTQK